MNSNFKKCILILVTDEKIFIRATDKHSERCCVKGGMFSILIPSNYYMKLQDLQFSYPDADSFDGSNANYLKVPNSHRFNRFDRYEMLLLIIHLQVTLDIRTKQGCLALERMIRKEFPYGAFTQREVAKWVSEHWVIESLAA